MHRYPTRYQRSRFEQRRIQLEEMTSDQRFVLNTFRNLRRIGVWNNDLKHELFTVLHSYLSEWSQWIQTYENEPELEDTYTSFIQLFATILTHLSWFHKLPTRS